ncbi:cutinase family protein [Corynebacterium macginleyi]|uniref:cutinase family protein n=1 Tax=Corynebacterium macginleyi TaxID=38290 RepID=UPI00190AB524|nr:cutinase family protein [Corynebacterium macginleyi]MBK4145938.1 cutinase family protein [Corynebacterium macginleyi]
MRKIITVLAALVLIVVIGAGAAHYFSTSDSAGPRSPEEDQSAAPPEKSQPEWCPSVEFISAPGTWESAADDDPLNPSANPRSFMLSITQPLQEAYGNEVKVWTLPYTAQFKNINAQQEMSYDDSRNEGTAKMNEELRSTHESCPQTKFILSGFSQGAVIAGDVADDIGGGEGVIPAENIVGVALIADGRRENGVGHNPGHPLGGVGAEIALEPVSGLIQPIVPGATMRGARPHGFGQLADRTFQICAPDDSICDAPTGVGNGLERAKGLIVANGVHAQYASNHGVIDGTTADQWVLEWVHRIIDAV